MAKGKKKSKSNNSNNNISNISNVNNENADPANNAAADVACTLERENSATDTPQPTEEPLAPETPQQLVQSTLEQSEVSNDAAAQQALTTPLDQMQMDDLRAEVLALRQQLQAKDVEIAELKAQANKPAKIGLSGLPPVTDMAQLQERLAKLRKDQAEADAARDTAWGQLKSVVSEISKLANPDYVASLVKQQAAESSDNGPVNV